MTTCTPTGTPPAEAARTAATARRAQGLLALGVLAAVAGADQATKWWAWRHVPVEMNDGGSWFVGATVSSWFSGAWNGALIDLAGGQVLTLALFALVRRRRPLDVLLAALLLIGGWGSNLLDRLGLHLLTAPGAGRGVVDFLRWGPNYFNLADVCIVIGTVLFGLGAVHRCRRGGGGGAARWTGVDGARPWREVRRWALVAAIAPAVLGSVLTLTTSTGQVTIAATPLGQLLGQG